MKLKTEKVQTERKAKSKFQRIKNLNKNLEENL